MNQAAAPKPTFSRAERDREVVQRTAELLTSSLSLEELFHAVCSLLARFVDASTVFIALKEGDAGRVAFLLQNGVAGRLENRRIQTGSNTEKVLRTGRSLLKRRLEDWSDGRLALTLPGVTNEDNRISAIFVPLKFGAKVIGVLSVQSDKEDAYDNDDVELLQTCALYLSVRIHQAQLETQSARLENIAATDSLTGVLNRRSFNERLHAEWRRAARRNSSLAVMLIDVDFFKAFNDTYGHVAGDAALQQVAHALSSCLGRSEDVFARYGGEEFVAVLPDTTLSGALSIAERMRQAAFDLGIAHSGSALLRLTISAGVACCAATRVSRPDELIQEADAALYRAKRGGRNQIAAENYRSDAPPALPSKAHRHNLPSLRGETIGRADQIRQVRKLLRSSRLLTIAGPAGGGKSRVAIDVARHEIARYPDGVFYIDCSTVSSERHLANKIAATLGLPETGVAASDSNVCDFLASKRALLVLDNCDGTGAAGAKYMRSLAAHVSDVRVLVTCREPLLVAAEVAFILPPLEQNDGVSLFFKRANAVAGMEAHEMNRSVVETLCRDLAGSPRAIQLAAAQLGTLSLGEIARSLPSRLALERQASNGFVEWSYGVLSPPEQTLLRGLSVFAGGATPDAVEQVCSHAGALTALVDKGLVTKEPDRWGDRFAVPSAIRAFAASRLIELRESHETRMRHARYFCERAAALETAYSTKQWRTTLEAMLPEAENLREALIFTVTEGNDRELGAQIICDLVNYWQALGLTVIGREWIEQVLARGDQASSKHVRARLLCGLARLDTARSKVGRDSALLSVQLHRELGDERGLASALFEAAAASTGIRDVEAADRYFDESFEIAQRIGDIRRQADALNGKAVIANWGGNKAHARELLEASLALFRQLEDDRGVATLLGNLGDLAATMGDYDRAVLLARQSLAILERLHDAQSTGWQLMNLGSFELKRGNTEAARPALRRSLELLREYQDDWLSAICLDCLSRLALREKDWGRALRLAGFADGVLESIGVPRQPPDQLDYEEVVRRAGRAVGRQAAREVMSTARGMGWHEAVREARSI